MAGLNQQHDVEVVEICNLSEQFDLIPASEDGVRAISGCFGCVAEMKAPVRVTDAQYRKFNEYVRQYARDRGKAFSTGTRQRFLGQKQADQSDLNLISDSNLPNALQERLSCDSRFLCLDRSSGTQVVRLLQ